MLSRWRLLSRVTLASAGLSCLKELWQTGSDFNFYRAVSDEEVGEKFI